MRALITFIAILTVGIVTAQDFHRNTIWRLNSGLIEVTSSTVQPENCLPSFDFGGTNEIAVHRDSNGNVVRRSLTIGSDPSYTIIDETHYDFLADVLSLDPGLYYPTSSEPIRITTRSGLIPIFIPRDLGSNFIGNAAVGSIFFRADDRDELPNELGYIYHLPSDALDRQWFYVGGTFYIDGCGHYRR